MATTQTEAKPMAKNIELDNVVTQLAGRVEQIATQVQQVQQVQTQMQTQMQQMQQRSDDRFDNLETRMTALYALFPSSLEL
jgi:uncharacterized phage infection (PIP) family protein YhgE